MRRKKRKTPEAPVDGPTNEGLLAKVKRAISAPWGRKPDKPPEPSATPTDYEIDRTRAEIDLLSERLMQALMRAASLKRRMRTKFRELYALEAAAARAAAERGGTEARDR